MSTDTTDQSNFDAIAGSISPLAEMNERDIVNERAAADRTSDGDETSSEAKKAPTSFLDLPAELRNDIYIYFFNPYDSDPRHQDLLQDPKFATEIPREREPALLRTCRQIRHEATPIWINETIFVANFSLCIDDPAMNNRVAWCIEAMGPEQASKIQQLELVFVEKNYNRIAGEVNARLDERFGAWPEAMFGFWRQGQKICKKDVLEAYGLDGLGLDPEAIRVWFKKKNKKTGLRLLVKN